MTLTILKKYLKAQKPENAQKNEIQIKHIYIRDTSHNVSYEGKQRRDGSQGGERSLRVTLGQSHAQ